MAINLAAFTACLSITLLLQSNICNAELLPNGNAFLYGDNIEVGLGPDGAFGADVVSPAGISKGKLLGYISDPSKNKFQQGYIGDFFLPGYPEEGWAVTVNGKNYNNNSVIAAPEIIGHLYGYKETATSKLVSWKGSIEGLEITQNYRIYKTGLAIIFDVILKNTTSMDMQDVYYMRTVDPDNNADQNPVAENALDTTNTIISQGNIPPNNSSVIATQLNGSYLELSGYGQNSRVSFGGQFNRDPVAVFTGNQLLQHSGSNTSDESISIAYKFDTIKAGESVKFRAGYQLSQLEKPSLEINNQQQQTYQLGDPAIPIINQDIIISGTSLTLLAGATISINNPQNGDKLTLQDTLPSGIQLDTTENNNDSQLYLTGISSIANYKTALKQIVFSNTNSSSNTKSRQIIIQIVDDNYTLSNASQAIIDITIPVTVNNSVIAGDDIVNQEEQDSIALTGHAAPNALINILITDAKGQHIIKNITANTLGQWSLENNPIDLTSLNDGNIEISITATDEKGAQSNFSKTIIKDSQLVLGEISPSDGEYISNPIPTFRGKTDPQALISITLIDGREYKTKANAEGIWEITLDKFPLGATLQATINAKDAAGNEKNVIQTVKILALSLNVDPIATDNNGISTSTRPVFSGTSKANTTITIQVAITETHSEICKTNTDAMGNWSCQLPILISGGPYETEIQATDEEGNSTLVTKTISIPKLPLIIETPVNNAVIAGNNPSFSGTSSAGTKVTIEASTGETCSAITDDKNHWSCQLPSLALGKDHNITISNEDDAGNKVVKTIAIKTNELPLLMQPLGEKNTAASSRPTLMGTSAPNTKITITVSTGATCNTTTDSLGNWFCELPKLPVGGPYNVSIKAEDKAGNVTTISQTITIPEIPLVIITPPSGAIIETLGIMLSGTSNANSKITVLGPDGQRCTTTADSEGVWSCQLNDLQTGTAKYITVISNDKLGDEKTVLLPVKIANASGSIKTVTGGGSSSPLLLLLLGLFIHYYRTEKKQ